MAEIEEVVGEVPTFGELSNYVPGVRIFTIEEIQAFTNGFQEENIIGRGGQGKVFKGQISFPGSDVDGQQYAVKESDLDGRHEAHYLSLVHQHRHIISLIGVSMTRQKFYMVMPLMKNGDLHSNFRVLRWDRLMTIVRGAPQALQVLHNYNPKLICQDFKSSNILLDENWEAVLCDFGTVRPESEGTSHYTVGYVEFQVFASLQSKKYKNLQTDFEKRTSLGVEARGKSSRGKFHCQAWKWMDSILLSKKVTWTADMKLTIFLLFFIIGTSSH